MRHRWMGLIVVVVLFASASGCRRARDMNRDRADVEQVFNKYLESLNTADVALASQVWLNSPDVLVVTPFGRVEGWDSGPALTCSSSQLIHDEATRLARS
jgi:hypothetical protein